MLVRQLLPHGDVQDVTSGGMSTVMVRPPDGPMYTSTTSQPIPQSSLLQTCSACVAAHAAPPWAGAAVMARARVWTPPPHVREQEPHGPQSPTAQSTAAGGAPRQHGISSAIPHPASASVRATVADAPRSVTANVSPAPGQSAFVRQPRPHGDAHQTTSGGTGTVAVALFDGPMYTATASQPEPHAAVPQPRVSSVAGHAPPPGAAGTVTVLALVCVPPPHDLVHVDQGPQALTPQSVADGQASW